MDITLKYKIVEKIIQSNDDSMLNEVKLLFGLSENDFWNEIPVEIQQGINKAKSELDRGEGIPHVEIIMSEIKQEF